jgi:hypothetical protein
MALMATSALAQLSPDQMKREMEKPADVNGSRFAHQSGSTTQFSLGKACGGDGNNNGPCGHGLDFDQACGTRFNACYKQWVEDNETIAKYNKWLRDCKPQQAEPLPPPPVIKNTPPAPSPWTCYNADDKHPTYDRCRSDCFNAYSSAKKNLDKCTDYCSVLSQTGQRCLKKP